ncbi:hypothetical protein NliqN6_3251 [Naganishia liquefaciens]|uniref:Uncharacterized protein n=1 Tax=Naganishia liquefaciens TaxID=104408 RepID=A0A8H3TTP2_9TREE|nr:hypothetical protein NliqN6_3251 [Naganishia liquefaciens]
MPASQLLPPDHDCDYLSKYHTVHAFAIIRVHANTPTEVCIRHPTATRADDDQYAAIKSSSNAIFMGSRQCPTDCPSDPYVRPGMLYFGNKSRETRWVPFPVTDEEDQGSRGSIGQLREIDHQDERGIEHYAAEALMRGLVVGKEKVIGWARDKYVLFVGARFGMVDDESADWWKSSEFRPLTFEERIPKVMVAGMEATGLNPTQKPDLIILGSLFWDESFIVEARDKYFQLSRSLLIMLLGCDWTAQSSQHYDIPVHDTHGFSYAQIRWHRMRMQKLIHHLRDMYGDETIPMMYRTRQIRKQAFGGGMLKIFQLDQSCRAVAKNLGLR